MRVNGEPERWLVAARLSRMTKKDRERGDEVINGIQTQDRRSTEWAQQEGHVIVGVTKDRNVSGAIPPWERPELGPWLTDPVKLIQYDGIVAYEVSRLSREFFDTAWLRKWAEENHKKLYVIKERLSWPDNRDGMLWSAEAERAYQDRQDMIEKITRELNALEEAGKLVGRPPFGYASEGPKYDRRLVPTDTGREYIPLIFKYCIDGCATKGCIKGCMPGWSMKRIVDWLRAEGVKPVSGVWWERSVAGIIKNPVCRGQRCKRKFIPSDDVEERDGKILRWRYGDRWLENPRWQYGKTIHECEALVDATTWKRANESLVNRPNRGYSDPENRAMLSEALYCPFCEDSPMYRHRATSRGRAYYYYRCFGRGSERESCGNMVRVELVDQAVNDIIEASFDVPVMKYDIIHGNEAEIQKNLDHLDYELAHLSAKGLSWKEEDAEREKLRAEYLRWEGSEFIADRVELVETGENYLELWQRTPIPGRGPWLASHEFRVTASREEVTVGQNDRSIMVPLNEPERQAMVRDTTPVYRGKCGCGCGSDIYGSRYGNPKKFVNAAHRQAAARRRWASRGNASPSPAA
jgi:site-specific DNA recombinase